MSTFKAEVRVIESINPHSNADRLAIGRVKGLDFQFVVQKGSYAPGDLVVYFPVDSLFPQSLIESLGLNYLSGPEKNRVKTIKLRGEYSQGLVLPVDVLPLNDVKIGDDVTEALGIKKYEAPVKLTNIGRLKSLPLGLSAYDIEGYERYPEAVEYLMDKPVQVSEKLEGTNFSLTVTRSGKVYVNSRNHTIEEETYTLWQRLKFWWKGTKPRKVNLYWDTMRRQPELMDGAKAFLRDHKCEWVTVYGEMCGPNIQGNIYGLDKPEIFVFDILTDTGWMKPAYVDLYFGTCQVPIISHGLTLRAFLNGKTLSDASNGESYLAEGVAREGIVVKPLIPISDFPKLGRLILKKRSPEYLSNERDF